MKDMKNLIWLGVSILLFGLLFAGPIAEAAQLTRLGFTCTVPRGYDQGWEVDSVYLVVQRYSDEDSVLSFKMTQNVAVDTHSYWYSFAPGNLNANNSMNAWALVYINTLSYPIHHDVHVMPFQTYAVDTLQTGVAATATVDSTDFAYVWNDNIVSLASRTVTSSATGTGVHSDSIRVLNTADSTPIGAGVQIWLRPNDGGANLTNTNDANGWANFSVNADTFLVYAWTPGYQQVTTPDTNGVPNKDTTFTLWMSATSAAAAASPGLTPVAFNFFGGTGTATTNVILRYKLASNSTQNWHFDSTKVFDPSEVFEARSAASGQVTVNVVPNDSIYTAGYQTGKTTWQFWAINPATGKQILGEDGIKITVPASASGLVWPDDFE